MDEKQPLSKKALRKLRRRAENDFYAHDARFWVGKIKSADRMLYDRPADRNALRGASSEIRTRRLAVDGD